MANIFCNITSDMASTLEDIVSPEDLKKFEKLYADQAVRGVVESRTQFEYAWCLVRSRHSHEIRKGIALLEDLYVREKDNSRKRDYNFYLATGHTRVKEYEKALHYVKNLLRVEPENVQALELKQYVESKIEKEGLMGMAIVGGGLLALGGAIGLAAALLKRN